PHPGSRSEGVLCLYRHGAHPHLHSFPTRRSSDLFPVGVFMRRFPPCSYDCVGSGSFYRAVPLRTHAGGAPFGELTVVAAPRRCRDRKSTRLNSSHVKISYAVFCLKKKKYVVPGQG